MNFADFIAGPRISGVGAVGFIIIMIWSLVWKGLALWRAARREEKTWFVVLMVLNTLGILEIIYYFLIAKSENKIK